MNELNHIINDYYYGNYDSKNLAVYTRKIRKDGGENFKPIAFYSSVCALLKGIKRIYAREELMNQDVETLIKNLEEIDRKIEGE